MKNLRLCFARPCRADVLLRQVEIAQIGAEHRDSKGNLLPLSPDADLRLVTLAAQHIIERAWGKPRDYDPSEDKQAPSGFRAADYTTEELEQLQLILERGKEREAAGGVLRRPMRRGGRSRSSWSRRRARTSETEAEP